eukprot:1443989-Alexandrium_andersonii.AAC.1
MDEPASAGNDGDLEGLVGTVGATASPHRCADSDSDYDLAGTERALIYILVAQTLGGCCSGVVAL